MNTMRDLSNIEIELVSGGILIRFLGPPVTDGTPPVPINFLGPPATDGNPIPINFLGPPATV
jgi:hypothetical protein